MVIMEALLVRQLLLATEHVQQVTTVLLVQLQPHKTTAVLAIIALLVVVVPLTVPQELTALLPIYRLVLAPVSALQVITAQQVPHQLHRMHVA